MLALTVHVNRECQVFAGLEQIDFFFQKRALVQK